MDGIDDIFGDDLSSNATKLHQHHEKAKRKRPSALSDTDEEQQPDEPEVISSSGKPAEEFAKYMFGERRAQVEEKCDEYPRVEFLQSVVKRQDSYKPTPVEDDEYRAGSGKRGCHTARWQDFRACTSPHGARHVAVA